MAIKRVFCRVKFYSTLLLATHLRLLENDYKRSKTTQKDPKQTAIKKRRIFALNRQKATNEQRIHTAINDISTQQKPKANLSQRRRLIKLHQIFVKLPLRLLFEQSVAREKIVAKLLDIFKSVREKLAQYHRRDVAPHEDRRRQDTR